MKKLAIALVACLSFFALSGIAAAQDPQLEYKVTVQGDRVSGAATDHFLTFSGPVGIPETGLAPGTYIFRVIAPSVVQVLSKDKKTVYATFFTVPTSRAEAADSDVIDFAKVGDSAPLRIVKWFEPNQVLGRELIYPKAMAAADTER